jgi:peroxiredoxin
MPNSDLAALYMSAEQRWMDRWLEGPTLEGNPLRRGQRAPDISVSREDGSAMLLSDAWADRPALVMLWRHLGCGCGLDRAGRLQTELPMYEDAGLNVVICAPAEPERIAVYRERYGVPVPMYSDPDYSAHKAFGLGHWSVEQVLYDAPEEFCELRADTGEQFQADRRAAGRPLVDDPFMQSGEFVVDNTGMIRVAYLYNYCEDYPDPRIFTTAARLAQ